MQEWQPPPSSPLPVALALMGTFAPLLILGSDPAIQAERLAWALAASLLAGLVSASVGVALRSSNLGFRSG